MSSFKQSGISKPPRAKPTANASKFLADLKAKIDILSPKEESDIQTRFFAWMNENRKLEIRKSAEEKRKKFFEIADTILTSSRSQGIFEDLSFIDKEKYELSEEYFNIQYNLQVPDDFYSEEFFNIQCPLSEETFNNQCNIPENIRFEWIIEEEKKLAKKVQISSATPIKKEFPEASLKKTLRRIFFTDLIIHNYLYGPYKN